MVKQSSYALMNQLHSTWNLINTLSMLLVLYICYLNYN